MGIASHLGSWLLGTVKNTSGTTAGTVRNMGATIVAQTTPLTAAQVAASSGSLGAIPAGACITAVSFVTSTLFASATTLKVTIAGVDVAAAATITSAGVYPQTQSATFAPVAANVGATDALVTYTATGSSVTGAVTVIIAYVVRNADGTYIQSTFQN
jgi:hypothetical protein